jgi:hypothetical protein
MKTLENRQIEKPPRLNIQSNLKATSRMLWRHRNVAAIVVTG